MAENWPPRDVIRKHRLKKPIPTTKILQETQRDVGGGGEAVTQEHDMVTSQKVARKEKI